MGKYCIEYDKSKCIGAGNCVAIAPETWELDEKGIAKPKITQFEEKDLQKNMDAAISCPTHAIVIKDDIGKQYV